jgi:membrane protease YdiL (CAAX protease family)
MDHQTPPDQSFLSEPPPPPPPPTPWGFWATLGFSVVIALAFIFAQGFAVAIYVALTGGVPALEKLDAAQLASDGKVLVLATLCSAPISVGLSILFASLRNPITVREYLALRWPAPKVILKWLGLSIVLLIVVDVGMSFIKGHATEDFMKQTLESVGSFMPLLWIVLVIAAPFSEEFLFRGFLFTGLAHSRAGPLGAVIISAICFTSIHVQYDLQGLVFVFFLGLLLASARWKTNSLWLCILLHGLMNFTATATFMLFGR